MTSHLRRARAALKRSLPMTSQKKTRAGAETPAALAKEAQARELAAIRKRAWETRRRKYGPRGHCGSYSR